MAESIGVGIAGYGYAGRSFHSYLAGLADGLHVRGIMAPRSEQRQQAAREHSCATYARFEDVLADDGVGLVVLATPHDTHCDLAIQAMQAGKHVVTDKIICMTVEEADRMMEEAERQGVLFSVFHNRRWDGDFLTVKQVMGESLLGDINLVEQCVYGYNSPRTWRGEIGRVGSLLYDWGAHLVDQALLLIREPVDHVLGTAQFRREGQTVETWGRCQITFAGGTVWVVEQSNMALATKPHWFILGTTGSLVKHGVDPQEAYMKRGEIENATENLAERAVVTTTMEGERSTVVPETIRGDWRAYYQNIADVLLTGAELAVKPAECRRALRVLNAYKESCRTGMPVILDNDVVV
ncbi:MAG: Gfo/Idh/MocA family oxidoreductase [Lentisphaerae bacterium]|jgi:scyllo-inositol 2-dehydrogenase (NADP+)|nr:Gfo/Idh/MocA family oxidoreductase [Lentisphaerota bacterium]MBT4821607.1 Gfo/Idh/MocA family oxidoreductase [Lentisphaerota bacterium]MBT5608151.1 Gfo/Idh/MocA family oxidoreductase [Lentisphaerota bacterium]MBT7058699.1 Gfo/Idh/MocA family oxidoreductase [Lentisphaerota bacterium]MBT7847671.1 Gfo/Idh/MocA family oxidoreductase [Lentisphaerota bacterium]